VAHVTDGNQFPQKLISDVVIVEVVDLGRAPFPTAFADSAGAFEHKSTPVMPFGCAEVVVISVPPFSILPLPPHIDLLQRLRRSPVPFLALFLNRRLGAMLVNVGGIGSRR
jgi:hypothetical protein